MLMQSRDVETRSAFPCFFRNGLRGDSRVNQELGHDLQMVGEAVPRLPQPEHLIHEAVVEEEDGIETGS